MDLKEFCSKGGTARALALSPERRKEIARRAGKSKGKSKRKEKACKQD